MTTNITWTEADAIIIFLITPSVAGQTIVAANIMFSQPLGQQGGSPGMTEQFRTVNLGSSIFPLSHFPTNQLFNRLHTASRTGSLDFSRLILSFSGKAKESPSVPGPG